MTKLVRPQTADARKFIAAREYVVAIEMLERNAKSYGAFAPETALAQKLVNKALRKLERAQKL